MRDEPENREKHGDDEASQSRLGRGHGDERVTAERLKILYEMLSDTDPVEWARLLDQHCSDDLELRSELVEMLSCLPQARDFIETPLTGERELFQSIIQSILIGRRIGNYKILEEVGQGGMGTVYRAVRDDEEYTVEVAIKLVWPGFDREEIRRGFRQERQIMANLNHPRIARLLDGGTTEDGWPYFVMEFIEGQPLTTYCNERWLSIEDRLKLFEQVCDAVAFAHRRKVIHRDLKPGNIFVTSTTGMESPEVKLLDFGIAKIFDPTLSSIGQSVTGNRFQAMTPEYASPEQVKGQNVAPTSDVYSLGVVLYELLTGVHPVRKFRDESSSLLETFQAICADEVIRPSRIWESLNSDGEERQSTLSIRNSVESSPGKLRRRLTGDLDAIILKAMRQAPAERYATVEELADDLRRFREGRPVFARRGAFGYSLRKFVKRYRLPLLVVVIFLILMASIGSIFLYREYRRMERLRVDRQLLYGSRLREAQAALLAGDLERFERGLTEIRADESPTADTSPGFEWRYLWNLTHRDQLSFKHEDDIVYFFDYEEKGWIGSLDCRQSMDDENARLRFEGCTFHLWDNRSGQELFRRTIAQSLRDLIFIRTPLDQAGTPRNLLILRGDSFKQVWALDSVELPIVNSRVMADYSPVRIVSNQFNAWMSRDGQVALTGILDDQLKVTLPVGSTKVNEVLAPLTGDVGLVKEEFERITLWDLRSWRQRSTLALDGRIGKVLPDWNEQRLIALSGGQNRGEANEISVWDLQSSKKIGKATESQDRIEVFQILPGGKRLVSGLLSGRITIRELPSLRQLSTFVAHDDWINDLLVLGRINGGLYLTASNDQTVRIWDAESNRLRTELRGHRGDVTRLIMSNDNRRLFTSSRDRTLKVWEVERLLEPTIIEAHENNIYTLAYSADGKQLATGSEDGTAKVWNTVTGQMLTTLRTGSRNVLHVAFSPAESDGKGVLAAAGADGVVRLWETGSWQELRQLRGHARQVHELTFSPDGRWLASASDDMTVRIWDAKTGELIRVISGYSREVFAVAFSPDGKMLATGGWEAPIRIYNVETGELVHRLTGHEGVVWSVRFSPDGQTLASAGEDRTIIIWNIESGQKRQVLRGHFDEIFSLAFSPDGSRIASASNDRTVRLWEPLSGREMFQFNDHKSQVYAVAFSPDGQRLASGSWDRTVRFYIAPATANIGLRSKSSQE